MASSGESKLGRRLRVLCCSGSLEGGGSERQLWQLASHLNRDRFAASVYLLYRRGHYIEQLPSDVPVSAFWDEFDESKRYWPGQIRRLQIDHLARAISEQQVDVVYDRTFHMTLVTAAAASRARVTRVSVIVSPPSADFQKSHERFRWLKKRLLSKAYSQVGSTTIALSAEVADDAAAFYGLDRQSILVVPNPIDIKAVEAAAREVPKVIDMKASDATPRIAVVGRLSHEKGQRFAIEALKLAIEKLRTPLAMDVVGSGPDAFKLERLAEELGVRQHVQFHGFKANPYPLMRGAVLVCIPSEHEGLPNVALEAMAIGTPLVATNCGGSLRELIGSSERGELVAPGNSQALANAFCNVVNCTDEWLQRCAKARLWVEENHAIAPWLAQMGHILEAAARQRQVHYR